MKARNVQCLQECKQTLLSTEPLNPKLDRNVQVHVQLYDLQVQLYECSCILDTGAGTMTHGCKRSASKSFLCCNCYMYITVIISVLGGLCFRGYNYKYMVLVFYQLLFVS